MQEDAYRYHISLSVCTFTYKGRVLPLSEGGASIYRYSDLLSRIDIPEAIDIARKKRKLA